MLIPVENIYALLKRLLGDVEWLPGAPLIVVEGEHVDIHSDRVLDCGDVLDGQRIVDLVQTPLVEEAVIELRAVGVFTMSRWRDRGEDGVPEASIILVLDVDDRMIHDQEFGQLSVCSTGRGGSLPT